VEESFWSFEAQSKETKEEEKKERRRRRRTRRKGRTRVECPFAATLHHP